MTVIGNPMAEDLRRCCDALLAERDQLRTRVQELGAMARENRSRAVVELEAEMDKLRADARRYNAFFDAGLPITYLGQPYYTKADLDAAIDATTAEGGDGRPTLEAAQEQRG